MVQAKKLEITLDERIVLEKWADGDPQTDRVSFRARIVLAAARGESDEDIATDLGSRRKTVSRWRTRYLLGRLAGIKEVRKSMGRLPISRWLHTQRILDATRQEIPPEGGRWTCRSLAKHLQLSASLVQRVWKREGICPEADFQTFHKPPFEALDQLRLLGGFFLAGQRAVVVEVLRTGASRFSLRDHNQLVFQPTIVNTSSAPQRHRTSSSAKQIRLLVQQQCDFLEKVRGHASRSANLRLITDGAHSFSHLKIRRWLSHSERFSVHYSSASRRFLDEAEMTVATLAPERAARMLTFQLGSLAAPLERRPLQAQPALAALDVALDMGFDYLPLGSGLPTLVAAPIS